MSFRRTSGTPPMGLPSGPVTVPRTEPAETAAPAGSADSKQSTNVAKRNSDRELILDMIGSPHSVEPARGADRLPWEASRNCGLRLQRRIGGAREEVVRSGVAGGTTDQIGSGTGVETTGAGSWPWTGRPACLWLWHATHSCSRTKARTACQCEARERGLCRVTTRSSPRPDSSSTDSSEWWCDAKFPARVAARSAAAATRLTSVPLRVSRRARELLRIARSSVCLRRGEPAEGEAVAGDDEQGGAEGPDDRGAGQQVEEEEERDTSRRDKGAHRPADREARPEAFGEEHGGHRGDDQEAEHEENSRDRDRRSHDEPERYVEEEVPEADVEPLADGLRLVHRDQQEPPAEDVVEEADERVEGRRLEDLLPGDGEDVSDEHILQVLGLLRGLRHHENRHSRRDLVHDPDDGFLGDARLVVRARHREDPSAEEREAEREEIGGGGVQVVAGQVRDRRTESGDLGERKVHEDHAPLDDVHAEVGVDSGEDEARDEGRQQDLENAHCFPFIAPAKALMS